MPRARSNAVSGSRAPFVGARPSGGAQRGPLTIGSQRQQQQLPALQMQEEIGNQATMDVMTASASDGYSSFPPEAPSVSPGPSGPMPSASSTGASASLPPGYVDFVGAPSASGASASAAPQPSPDASASAAPQPTPGASASLPPGYVDYVGAPSASGASSSAASQPSPGGGSPMPPGYNEYIGMPSVSSDSGASLPPSYVDFPPELLASPQTRAPSAPAPEDGFSMKSMEASMPAFDSRLLPAHPHMHTALPSTTFYADDEERATYSRGFDSQGKMINADGSGPLNTIGAERPAALGAKGDRHIFTMDEGGSFHTADAIKENKTRSADAMANGQSQMERFHHSSFHSGEDVAGAGELQVRDGQIEMVSDASGHYRPGSEQMMQTVQQLGRNNVSMERLGVEFIGKQRVQNENGAWKTEKNLQASALELLGYENSDNIGDTEQNMRAAHSKKDGVMKELLAKSSGVPDGQTLKPSDMKPKPRPEEASSAPPASPAPLAPSSPVVPEHVYDYVDEGHGYNNIEDEAGEGEAEQAAGGHAYDVVEEPVYDEISEPSVAEVESEEDVYYN